MERVFNCFTCWNMQYELLNGMFFDTKEERIISLFLTISLVVISTTGLILGKVYKSSEATICIGILCIASLVCIVSVWIATTIGLRNK